MTTAAARKPRKRAPAKKAVPVASNGAVSRAPGGSGVSGGPAAVAASNGAPKKQPKPGDKNFDWTTEYPGEEVFVFTASDGTTIGLTRLGPNRRPKPGKLALLEDQQGGGIKVLWYFLKLASSDASREVQAELEEEDYAAMTRAWAEFAGIELGE